MTGFNTRWESDVYGASRHLNRYPFDVVVSLVLSRFGGVANRGSVRVLDIGCGAGNHLWFLAREGFSAAGIDGSQSATEFAKRRLVDDGLDAETLCGDFVDLPWPDASFDIALDRGSITHNRRSAIEKSLDEVRRVLKPGGLFFSQMFADGHSAIVNGEPLGDGAYDQFGTGYFADIGVTFFASRDAIDALHGARFRLETVENVSIVRENSDEPTYQYWNITAIRP